MMFKNNSGFTLIEIRIGDYPYYVEGYLLNKLIELDGKNQIQYNIVKRKIEIINKEFNS